MAVMTAEEQAAFAAMQSGQSMQPVGYLPDARAQNILSDAVFVGVHPQGPFDRMYQGVQRWNSASPDAMGYVIADIPNPLWRLSARTDVVNYYTSNSAPQAGPAVFEWEAEQSDMPQSKGLLATIMDKLRGSSS
jgi:hypothetical protein